VRREKGAGLEWESLMTKAHPALSLQAVAIVAGVEATKRPKPPMRKAPARNSASEQAIMRRTLSKTRNHGM